MRVLRICGYVVLLVTALCAVSCGSEESSVLSVYNYPNPCTPVGRKNAGSASPLPLAGTTLVLQYNQQDNGSCGVYIYVHDLSGAPVTVWYEDIPVTPGDNSYTIPWDVTNDRGEALAPGVYILKMVTTGVPGSIAAQSASHKMMVQ